MIKLFRNIRQTHLVQGKTSIYLRYAIGEIVLVVIGILIALQINDWNDSRIQKQKESVYLKNFNRDLKEQLASIEFQIAYETKIRNVATPIVVYYKKHQGFQIDSLFSASIGILVGRKTFVKKAPTYSELISSGHIDIISNPILKDNIINYYQELERIELVINKNNNLYVDAVFIPEMIRLTEMQVANKTVLGNLNNQTPLDSLMIDLNESGLKQITRQQLAIPENELRMINAVNYRNRISMIHFAILTNQKEKTQQLLDKLISHD